MENEQIIFWIFGNKIKTFKLPNFQFQSNQLSNCFHSARRSTSISVIQDDFFAHFWLAYWSGPNFWTEFEHKFNRLLCYFPIESETHSYAYHISNLLILNNHDRKRFSLSWYSSFSFVFYLSHFFCIHWSHQKSYK